MRRWILGHVSCWGMKKTEWSVPCGMHCQLHGWRSWGAFWFPQGDTAQAAGYLKNKIRELFAMFGANAIWIYCPVNSGSRLCVCVCDASDNEAGTPWSLRLAIEYVPQNTSPFLFMPQGPLTSTIIQPLLGGVRRPFSSSRALCYFYSPQFLREPRNTDFWL